MNTQSSVSTAWMNGATEFGAPPIIRKMVMVRADYRTKGLLPSTSLCSMRATLPRHMSEPSKRAAQAQPEAGAPEQCTFLICTRAGRCQQPDNCMAGVVPLTPEYQPLYKAGRRTRDE